MNCFFFQVTEDNNVNVNLHEELPTQTSRTSSSTGETSSSIVSAPPPSVALNKRRRNTMADEAYCVMKEVGSNVKKKDEFDIFGDLVACELRKCSDKRYVALAKRRISDILFDVEMREFNRQPQSNSGCSSSLSLQESSSCPAGNHEDSFENSPSTLNPVVDTWGDDFYGGDENANTLLKL